MPLPSVYYYNFSMQTIPLLNWNFLNVKFGTSAKTFREFSDTLVSKKKTSITAGLLLANFQVLQVIKNGEYSTMILRCARQILCSAIPSNETLNRTESQEVQCS